VRAAATRADILKRMGQLEGALQAYREALPLAEALGDQESLLPARRDLANIHALGPGAEGALDPYLGSIRLASLTTDAGTWVVDARACPEWAVVLGPALMAATLVGHNVVFEWRYLEQAGIRADHWFDTMLAAQVLDGGLNIGKPGHFTLEAVVGRILRAGSARYAHAPGAHSPRREGVESEDQCPLSGYGRRRHEGGAHPALHPPT
jgi:hypothetical protein